MNGGVFMKIKELSEITGLTKRTIRFYEDAGLIHPEKSNRNGRDFREYSQQDAELLREVIVLRKARFTIDEIRGMQSGAQPVHEIFPEYYQRMQLEKRELNRLMPVLAVISERSIDTAAELAAQISDITAELSLPYYDVHPHFRYIDELEEKLGRKDADKKRRKADWQQTVAMTQASTLVQCHTKPGVRDGSMPGASVLMTMRMLDDEKK